MSANGDSHSNKDVRFEATDIATRPVVWSVLGLAVFTLVFTAAAHFYFVALAAREAAEKADGSPLAVTKSAEHWQVGDFGAAAGEAAAANAKLVPEPRLQLDPKMDLVTLRAAEDKVLRRLGWVDKASGIVQVPIERGMQMYLAKGVPARAGEVPAKMVPHEYNAPAQMREGAGAPDWYGAAGLNHEEAAHEGPGHAAPSHPAASHGAAEHESAPGAHGH